MPGLTRPFEPNARSLSPAHERTIDRIYFVIFVAMLSLMGIVYFCLCVFLLWAFL
jgi:hypothetical protein